MSTHVRITAFTDPACTWCWGSEPSLRAVEAHYGEQVSIRPVMGGLVKDIRAFMDSANDIGGDPARSNAAIAAHWLEASARHGMPVKTEGFALFSAEDNSTWPLCEAWEAASLRLEPHLASRPVRQFPGLKFLFLIRHLFQLRLCPDTLASAAAEVNLCLLLDVLQRLPIESGYVAPAISWTRHPAVGRPDGRHCASAVYNRALDVHSNMATRFVIGGRCRGARSLVLLDQSLFDSIGGYEAMERLQAAGLSVRRFSSGVIIQVSDMPFEAVRVDTPVFARYIALAQELEAITLFDDLDLERVRFNANPDALDRYERRFMP